MLSAAALCHRAGRPTLRSSGPQQARHLGREPASVIIGLAAQAPRRLRPLSSNVRPRRDPGFEMSTRSVIAAEDAPLAQTCVASPENQKTYGLSRQVNRRSTTDGKERSLKEAQERGCSGTGSTWSAVAFSGCQCSASARPSWRQRGIKGPIGTRHQDKLSWVARRREKQQGLLARRCQNNPSPPAARPNKSLNLTRHGKAPAADRLTDSIL